MTEKQIEQLKKVLSESKLPDNSVELDSAILKSAHDSASQWQDVEKADVSTPERHLFGLMPLSFLRSAGLATVLTLGTFVLMGQLISVDEELVVDDTGLTNVISNESVKEPVELKQTHIRLPENIALEPAPSQLSRDQILLSFDLSDTEELLAGLPLTPSIEPDTDAFYQVAVQPAIVDIDLMIRTGELNDARERYGELKLDCNGCGLPDTLEALIIVSQQFAANAADSEPG